MATTFEDPNDGSIILNLRYQADKTLLVNTIRDGAQYLYQTFSSMYGVYSPEDGHLLPFEELTNAQILTIINKFVSLNLRQLAFQHRANVAQQAAYDDETVTVGE